MRRYLPQFVNSAKIPMKGLGWNIVIRANTLETETIAFKTEKSRWKIRIYPTARPSSTEQLPPLPAISRKHRTDERILKFTNNSNPRNGYMGVARARWCPEERSRVWKKNREEVDQKANKLIKVDIVEESAPAENTAQYIHAPSVSMYRRDTQK